MEIILYGLLWLLSRRDRHALGYGPNLILDTSALQLSVLAPAPFYVGFELPELPQVLDAGLSALGVRHGVQIGFRQMMFPESFQWPSTYDNGQLLQFLDGRKAV
jgi:hypothetical protein